MKDKLKKELKSLTAEEIGFMRAGIDDIYFDRVRASNVSKKIDEIKHQLIPLLEERNILVYDHKLRTDIWKDQDRLKFDGWIKISDNMTGTIIYGR